MINIKHSEFIIVIVAITATLTITMTTTTMIDDNPFANNRDVFAQLQQQPIVGGPGDQTMTGDPNLAYPGNQMYGDTSGSLTSGGQGGNDVMTGGTNSYNYLVGDAGTVYSQNSGSLEGSTNTATTTVNGGTDTLTGGERGMDCA
jgi:hypothetical protein